MKWKLPSNTFAKLCSRNKCEFMLAWWHWAIVLLLLCLFNCPTALCQSMKCPNDSPVSIAGYGDEFLDATFQTETAWEPAITAAFSNYVTQPAGFGTGSVGFARHYWVSVADNVNGKFMSKFAFAAASKRSDCYAPEEKAGFWRGLRIAALHSIYTDRADSFERLRWSNFNWSGAPASLASAGLSNAYQPGPQRTWQATSIRFAENFGGHAGGDVGTQAMSDLKAWSSRTLRILLRTHSLKQQTP